MQRFYLQYPDLCTAPAMQPRSLLEARALSERASAAAALPVSDPGNDSADPIADANFDQTAADPAAAEDGRQ